MNSKFNKLISTFLVSTLISQSSVWAGPKEDALVLQLKTVMTRINAVKRPGETRLEITEDNYIEMRGASRGEYESFRAALNDPSLWTPERLEFTEKFLHGLDLFTQGGMGSGFHLNCPSLVKLGALKKRHGLAGAQLRRQDAEVLRAKKFRDLALLVGLVASMAAGGVTGLYGGVFLCDQTQKDDCPDGTTDLGPDICQSTSNTTFYPGYMVQSGRYQVYTCYPGTQVYNDNDNPFCQFFNSTIVEGLQTNTHDTSYCGPFFSQVFVPATLGPFVLIAGLAHLNLIIQRHWAEKGFIRVETLTKEYLRELRALHLKTHIPLSFLSEISEKTRIMSSPPVD